MCISAHSGRRVHHRHNAVDFPFCIFFPIQQEPWHSNIMADKGLKLFHECAAECVYMCTQEEECTSTS